MSKAHKADYIQSSRNSIFFYQKSWLKLGSKVCLIRHNPLKLYFEKEILCRSVNISFDLITDWYINIWQQSDSPEALKTEMLHENCRLVYVIDNEKCNIPHDTLAPAWTVLKYHSSHGWIHSGQSEEKSTNRNLLTLLNNNDYISTCLWNNVNSHTCESSQDVLFPWCNLFLDTAENKN
jgi:hypothetical protein